MEASTPLRHSPLTIVILVIAYLTALVVGLAGNVFVIFAAGKISRMKTATKYFIVNLAIADLLVLLVCLLPNLIAIIYVPWVMGWFLCKAVPYVQGVSVCASVYSLAVISADRLMAIRSSLSSPLTNSVARRIIALIWMWAAGLALPWLLYFDLVNSDESDPSWLFCIESWPPGINGNVYFVVANLGLCYLLPLAFISFCHLTVWLRVRRPQLPTNPSVSEIQLVHGRAKASVQKLVVVVVVGFAACWLPLYVIFVRVKLIPAALGPTEEKVLDYALPIAQWLGAANSSMNPIFYVFFNRNFRFALQSLLGEFSACTTTSQNRSNLQHHPNQGVGLRSNFARLRRALHRSRREDSDSRVMNSRHVASRETTVVVLHPENRKSVALTRSQTYQEAMANPL